jgi:phosphotransferase system HPr-like phosphotransfer protein
MKITKTILIDDIFKVKDFVSKVNNFIYDTDITYGRFVIDAKSIMGVLSLDISKPINFIYDEREEDSKVESIGKYFV